MADVKTPSTRDLICTPLPGAPRISPGGVHVAWLERLARWDENRYDMDVVVCRLDGGEPRRLTRGADAFQMVWLNDETLLVLKSAADAPPQVWCYEHLCGEPWQVTDHDGGVFWFDVVDDGVLFTGDDPQRRDRADRTETFGTFVREEAETSASSLYWTGLPEMRAHLRERELRSDSEAADLHPPVIEPGRLLPEPLSIQSVVASRSGTEMWINCQQRDDFSNLYNTSTFLVTTDLRAALASERTLAAGGSNDAGTAHLGAITPLAMPLMSSVVAVSPDGSQVAVDRGKPGQFRVDPLLHTIPRAELLGAATPQDVDSAMTRRADALLMSCRWTAAGLFADQPHHTRYRLLQLDDGVEEIDLDGRHCSGGVDVADSGDMVAVLGDGHSLDEVWHGTPDGEWRRLTDYAGHVSGWQLAPCETITWTSADGVEIEGLLRKPADCDPTRRYPLVFVVHGGPNLVDTEVLLDGPAARAYPVHQLVNRDVLVLQPNYRGSLGRGPGFSQLNVGNLGVGEMADLEAAVDHLDRLGWVDTSKVGCMGWSMGGYVSAFVGLHSTRFAAVSVGAGISDWYTDVVAGDLPQFPLEFVGASPFQDREPYRRAAPMSNLASASTPVLIQHGGQDSRIPLSNARELYRGLKSVDVPVELFVYPDSGHLVMTPRECHAVMQQNLAWFSHWLLGDDLVWE